ncbi:hypothetical protein [Paraburkholderia acidisoli]|uniref:Phage ABA sandwich domain-containing protein n=1 Tax=Paraburkholderia acidisoli TaxID=2571748 RepID=A0A7Z2JI06_9BURK|nr:hypothetical protein [Paraburkholderia acidisoli]QGZ66329.1 hypothetical protein FAZ98_31540 [Paraburkholderia acidisoli]QGZ66412.1 hypothetical protein FAZ98_32020 [Paraburkholderia acidisoli]
MTDRELLELAAHAAKFRVHGWIGEKFYVINPPNPAAHYDPFSWSPLDDDGDALRLAVKLGVCLETAASIEVGTFTYAGVTEGEYESGVEAWYVTKEAVTITAQEVYGSDPCAATRRAIVRAAAEIARAQAQ